MFVNKNPRTRSDLKAFHSRSRNSSEQSRQPGASTRSGTDIVTSPAGSDAGCRREDATFATTRPRLRQPSRRVRFPVKAYGGIKLISPWLSYERICDLRLGADHHVTVAQQMASPHQQVAVRRFPGNIVNNELQMLQQVRHTSFVAVLEAFRFEEMTYVVFEHMHVSFYEMERSRKRVRTLHLPALLGPVYTQASTSVSARC